MKTILTLALAFLTAFSNAATTARVVVQPSKLRQPYQGLGCGAMFFEGHITSLAARGKDDRQRQLYDDMFAKVNARYLHLMIRPTHEPQNDNVDPWTPAFDPANFEYCTHTLAIVKAARERRPDIELLATLGTPPPWMKTYPGMKVIESASSQETVKASAFLSAERTLVVHVVNSGARDAPLQLSIGGNAAPASSAARHRTSTIEDSAALEPLQPAGSGFTDTLPAQSLTTYQFTIR